MACCKLQVEMSLSSPLSQMFAAGPSAFMPCVFDLPIASKRVRLPERGISAACINYAASCELSFQYPEHVGHMRI